MSALGSSAARDALRVTAETITISMLAILVFGTPAAYWISTRRGALRDALVTLVELPLVLPPAVAGIGLLVAFGRAGLLGGTFDALGFDIAFTKVAVVLAVTFVASPFYLRTAIAAFEVVDPTLPAAARTLGARPGRVFLRVMLPLARGGLGAGAALAFARGLGEFGATIMFAGSLQGVTQTLSLAIYEQFDLDFDVALAISALLIVTSALVLLSVKLDDPMALRLRFTHPLRSYRASADLTVERGETVALVGPSGAGKTTVLRVVAGLLRPAEGFVALDEAVLLDTSRRIDVPPEHRRVGYLFQEYALFPHLDVWHNVRFGARRAEDVDPLLERFRIGELARARVRELSGGERQRVALARALARDPALLLLDEPLSALDAHTRASVRAELRELLDDLGLPTIVVTHDFEDAATLAHRVGVISDGEILQLATPTDLVALPRDAFVASFSGATVLPGRVVEARDGLSHVALDGGLSIWSADEASGPVNVAVYPWDVSLGSHVPDDSRMNHVSAAVVSVAPMGNRTRVRVGPIVAEITAASAGRLDLRPGVVAVASFKATAARLFPR